VALHAAPDELVINPQTVRYAEDFANLQKLRRIYEHLLPDTLDPNLPELPPPVVREATILFSDIRGFTALSERLADDPVRLLAVLNEHLTGAVNAVTRCGGVIEKFVGDGLMASFGARREQPDQAERAVAAGLALIGANERLNRRKAPGDFRLDVGVGISFGKLVVGVIGPPHRAEFGILGDPVNVAARLVASAGPAEMLLGEHVYKAAQNNINPETVGRTSIRGRSGEITVYRINLGRRS